MQRGSGIPPSEAPNRADEWSFSLCCVAIFLLAVCGSSLRDEPAMPFCVFDAARGPRFGDCLLGLSDFECLQCTLLYCASSGRSFAYMWGAGLRADLKFSTQRLNEEKSAQRARHEQRPAQTEVLGTQRVSFKERNRGMLTAAAGDSST